MQVDSLTQLFHTKRTQMRLSSFLLLIGSVGKAFASTPTYLAEYAELYLDNTALHTRHSHLRTYYYETVAGQVWSLLPPPDGFPYVHLLQFLMFMFLPAFRPHPEERRMRDLFGNIVDNMNTVAIGPLEFAGNPKPITNGKDVAYVARL